MMASSDDLTVALYNGGGFEPKPFKVVDADRDSRMGLTASTLEELIERARVKFDIDIDVDIRIVLEMDGTEIDDNDYFVTLEPDVSLMILCNEQRWTPYKSILTLGLAVETGEEVQYTNGVCTTSPVEELVWRLHDDLSFFPWLTTDELETISKMDTDEMKRIVPDVKFLEFLQDLSERYLRDKDKSERSSLNGGGSNGSNSRNTAASILNDPVKLIRMYSKSNHYLYSHCDPPILQQLQLTGTQQPQPFRTN